MPPQGVRPGSINFRVPFAKPAPAKSAPVGRPAGANIGPWRGKFGAQPTPAPKPARTLFTGMAPPSVHFEQAARVYGHRAAEAAAPGNRVEHANQMNQVGKIKQEVLREYLETGKINPNFAKYAGGMGAQSEARPGRPPKVGLFGKALGLIGQGEHALESGAGSAIGALQGLPGVTSRGGIPESNVERKRTAGLYGSAGVQAAETLGTFGAARGLAGLAAKAETAAGAKALQGIAADRAALQEVAGNAQRARGLVGSDVMSRAPGTARELERIGALGARQATPASRALRLGAATSAGYGKLLATSAPAKAALEAAPGEPKKNEPFAEKFWHSAIHTVANLPAAAIEGVAHPAKTISGMVSLYAHPEQAWNENPFGTMLAFLAPAAAAERGAGAVIRRGSKGRLLALERPGLKYSSGAMQAREWQPGLVTQVLQRAAAAATRPKVKVPGLKEVSGEHFKAAVDYARSTSRLHSENLTPHGAHEYTKSYLTADGRSGYAIIRHPEKLPDGRQKIELVNVFNTKPQNGIGDSLVRHAISQGANTLDAFEGKLTRKYAAHGFQTVSSEANWKPGGPEVLYMRHPNVQAATKWQERRDILGSRAGGFVRPGQVDLIKGGERLASNLETMKRHSFLDEHLPHDEPHATALMTLLQGEAKTPETFWKDVADRHAELKDKATELSHEDLAHNLEQQRRLTEMERAHQDGKLTHEDLEHYAKSAGEIARQQREDWYLLNQEGIGEPGQLNARNLTAVLIHGSKHLGRGELTFLEKPGPHPLVGLLNKAKQEREAARKEMLKAREAAKAVGAPRLTGVKSGWHFREEKAQERLSQAYERVHDIEGKLTTAVHTHALLPNHEQFPGVYDPLGNRVTAPEIEDFIHKHFGREMGFLSHRQERVQARSNNNYGPRSTYQMRTGGNFLAGAYDNSPAALRNHFDMVSHNLAVMRGRRSVAENLAVGRPEGGWYEDQLQAEQAAKQRNFDEHGQHMDQHLGKWVAYNVGANKVSRLIPSEPYGKYLERHGIVEHNAINEEKGAWAIMPQHVADRLHKWNKVEDQVQGSMLRLMTTPWRQTNLYTSVRWPFGTTQENAIRLMAHHVSPLVVMPYGKYTSVSFGTGSHIVRMLDDKITDPTVPHAQKQLAIFHRAMFGTGNFVGAQLHELEPALHQLSQDSFWGKVAENPINTKGWRPYRRAIGNALNRMETNAKIAAGGKLAMGDQQFFRRYREISKEQAAHDYVEKITTDPAESIKAAQKLMEVMGNWNHLTPYTRQAQAEWAPFALWWLNSAKFIFKTLPRDHPYATGLLAAMVTATGQENRNLKSYLEGTVPLTLPFLGKINLNPVHYSPFDIAGEPGAKAFSMIAPQIVEPAMTAKGVDPLTGEKFEGTKPGEGGEGTAFGRVAVSALESYIPGMRLASQLSREGGIPTKTSILPWESKPGSQTGFLKAVAKSLAPVMFNYVRSKAGEKGKQSEGYIAPQGGYQGGGYEGPAQGGYLK